jgi:hypothetical protein
MEKCQSLKLLSLISLEMDEDHCRVLGGYSRPDLEIVLKNCKFTIGGTSALAEILGRNQGPTQLDYCHLDNLVLANGLRGNSRLKSLKLRISNNLEVGNREILTIMGALRENKGLVDLHLGRDHRVSDETYHRVSGETWGVICASLETHPTLEVLDLRLTFANPTIGPAALTSRIQALLDIMKVNIWIHRIRLHGRYSEHELFQGSVIPYLDANRFRPRIRAIQKTRPIA